jgi:hypothetical protein
MSKMDAVINAMTRLICSGAVIGPNEIRAELAPIINDPHEEIRCALGDCDCEPDCGEWEGDRSLCPHQRVYCPTCGQRVER